MHKAQRDEVSGAVRRGALPAPGGLPGPAGERDGAQGGIRLQAALRSLPAAVRGGEEAARQGSELQLLCERREKKNLVFLFDFSSLV